MNELTNGGIDGMIDAYDDGRLSRRQLVARLTGLAAAFAAGSRLALAQEPEAATPSSTFAALDLNHIALRVKDIERSREFYRKHLGLTVASENRSTCFLRCRDENFVALFKSEQPGLDHYCYSIDGYDPGRAVETLKAAGIEPRRRGDRVYFDDPDGLEVQVAAVSHNV